MILSYPMKLATKTFKRTEQTRNSTIMWTVSNFERFGLRVICKRALAGRKRIKSIEMI